MDQKSITVSRIALHDSATGKFYAGEMRDGTRAYTDDVSKAALYQKRRENVAFVANINSGKQPLLTPVTVLVEYTVTGQSEFLQDLVQEDFEMFKALYVRIKADPGADATCAADYRIRTRIMIHWIII